MLRPKGGGGGGGRGGAGSSDQQPPADDVPPVDDTDGGCDVVEGLPPRVQQQDAESDHRVVPGEEGRGGVRPSLLVSFGEATPPAPSRREYDDGEATPPPAPSTQEEGNEVDEFFTLLDTTLHLPEAPPEPPPVDAPPPRVAFTGNGGGGGSGGGSRPSGRLGDRVVALRQ